MRATNSFGIPLVNASQKDYDRFSREMLALVEQQGGPQEQQEAADSHFPSDEELVTTMLDGEFVMLTLAERRSQSPETVKSKRKSTKEFLSRKGFSKTQAKEIFEAAEHDTKLIAMAYVWLNALYPLCYGTIHNSSFKDPMRVLLRGYLSSPKNEATQYGFSKILLYLCDGSRSHRSSFPAAIRPSDRELFARCCLAFLQ